MKQNEPVPTLPPEDRAIVWTARIVVLLAWLIVLGTGLLFVAGGEWFVGTLIWLIWGFGLHRFLRWAKR